MDLFVLDTSRDVKLLKKDNTAFNFRKVLGAEKAGNAEIQDDVDEDYNDADFEGLPPPSHDISHIIKKCLLAENLKKKDSKETKELDNFARIMGWTEHSEMDLDEDYPVCNNKVMNSLPVAIEQRESIPCLTDKKLKQKGRIERSKTKGKDWFDLKAPEMTEEIKNDLSILQMRSVLDPKHFYKKNDLKVLPKYFQVGTVMHSPLDYYNEKNTRKNKKKSLVEELMADADFQKFNKRKYKEVMEQKRKTGYHKANQKMKKLKKKKK